MFSVASKSQDHLDYGNTPWLSLSYNDERGDFPREERLDKQDFTPHVKSLVFERPDTDGSVPYEDSEFHSILSKPIQTLLSSFGLSVPDISNGREGSFWTALRQTLDKAEFEDMISGVEVHFTDRPYDGASPISSEDHSFESGTPEELVNQIEGEACVVYVYRNPSELEARYDFIEAELGVREGFVQELNSIEQVLSQEHDVETRYETVLKSSVTRVCEDMERAVGDSVTVKTDDSPISHITYDGSEATVWAYGEGSVRLANPEEYDREAASTEPAAPPTTT